MPAPQVVAPPAPAEPVPQVQPVPPVPAEPPRAAAKPAIPPQAPPLRPSTTTPTEPSPQPPSGTPKGPPPSGNSNLPPAPSDRAAKIIEEGRTLIKAGAVLKAREHYLANIGVAPAPILHELGRTFDPHYLSVSPSSDAVPSPQQAVSLYREALKYGAGAAQGDLDRLLKENPALK
ncbi:MAG: hypothetical protein AB7U18_22945 [Dehalococcoidia bacterium]